MATRPNATPTAYAAPPNRPLGVSILAVLVGLYGVLLILGGILLVAGASALTFLGVASQFAGLPGLAVGAVVLVFGLIVLGVALGLWPLRMRALVLALIVTAVELVGIGLSGNFVSFGFVFSLILFVYLLAVARHFR